MGTLWGRSMAQQPSSVASGYSSWFVVIVAVFVTCLLTANIIAVKLVVVGGLLMPAGIVIFEHFDRDCCTPSIAAFERSYRLKYRHELQFDPRYFTATTFDRSRVPDAVAVYEPDEPERDR